MPHEQMMYEYEEMRQYILVCKRQIELWSPIVAWRHVTQGTDVNKELALAVKHVTESASKLIVADIQRDLTNRGGFRQLWDGLDSGTKNEIVETWRTKVRARLDSILGVTKADS